MIVLVPGPASFDPPAWIAGKRACGPTIRRDAPFWGLVALLFAAAVPTAASALPTCAPASPARISRQGFVVDQIWQRYRGLTPEHRCCAKPCEPVARFAAKIEANAITLNEIARNPRVPQPARQKALADSNAMFAQRGDLASEFTQCLNDTRVRPGPAGSVCGEPELSDLDLAWVKWCDAFTDRLGQFRALLATTVGNSAGSWQVQSNYFRITPEGFVDLDSLSIRGYPATQLPPGKSTTPFYDLIDNLRFPHFPAGAYQRRMYMQFTASAIRLPNTAGSPPLDTSPIVQGPCPGLTRRPAG